MPAIDHHPTLDNLRYEHGVAEWSDEQLAAAYGIPERRSWTQWHAFDHDDHEFRHASQLEAALADGEV